MDGPDYELWSNERPPGSNIIDVYSAVDHADHHPLGYTDNMRHDPPHLAIVSSVGALFTHLSYLSLFTPKGLAERRENHDHGDGRPAAGPPGITHFVSASSQPQIENYAPLTSVRVTPSHLHIQPV
jgi:hypothetical protein